MTSFSTGRTAAGRWRSSSRRPARACKACLCATREICANLYAEIIERRRDWHHDDLDKGKIKVVYTGTPKDPDPIRKHVRRPSQNKAIQQRMKKADDELELVIVQSMWLTGFDSPPLHTLYLDRPMKGAALMQTLARVNRTYKNKQDAYSSDTHR